jgi:maleamate amidohydrolase
MVQLGKASAELGNLKHVSGTLFAGLFIASGGRGDTPMQHDATPAMTGNKAKDWMTIIPESDRKAYQKSDKPPMPGPKSALIVIDVTVAFTGSRPQPIEEAIVEFPTACGDAAWEALPRIKELIDLFRAAGRPVVFTRSDVRGQQFTGTATKTKRPVNPDPKFGRFPDMIVPRDN